MNIIFNQEVILGSRKNVPPASPNDEKKRFIAGTSKFLRKLEYDNLESMDREEILLFIERAIEELPYFKENWKEINKEG